MADCGVENPSFAGQKTGHGKQEHHDDKAAQAEEDIVSPAQPYLAYEVA
jgi:hypothetical protein